MCPCNEGGIRGAIAGGAGSYTFDCEGPTTVVTSSEIIIDADVVLDGGGLLTVDGNRTHRVFTVPSSATVELVDLTIANGNETEEHGGGIRNSGTLTVRSSTFTNNNAGRQSGCRTDDASMLCSEGGAIWNTGTLTIEDSVLIGNSAHFGGGLANRAGAAEVVGSAFQDNSAFGCRVGAVVCSGGGGVWNSSVLSMETTTVDGCMADWGGGIYTREPATLTECSVTSNAAGFDGGGLLNFATLAVIDSTISANTAGQSGGGIANQLGVLELLSSTLSGNAADSVGGGVFNPTGASAKVVNVTVSANSARTEGGGVYTSGDFTTANSTIAENSAAAGSAFFDAGSNESMRLIVGTIIEGDCDGIQLDSGGYNLESPGDTCGLDEATDLPSETRLELQPLADNGGPTETHALGSGSVAIDQIPESDCVDPTGTPLMSDQRGEPRPVAAGCDIGAFEVQP